MGRSTRAVDVRRADGGQPDGQRRHTQGRQEPQRRHERRTDRSPAPLESTAGREGVEGGAWRRATSASLSDAQRQERRLPRAGCLQARSQEGGLPDYFSPHYCRHSYASILLSEDGGRLLYVQEQLGHASIQETVDTYGKWLRKDGRGAVDTLCPTGWKAASAQR